MFTKEDMALHKGLMKLLNEATFPLKAREAHAFLAIYDWVQKLPEFVKVKSEIKQEPK